MKEGSNSSISVGMKRSFQESDEHSSSSRSILFLQSTTLNDIPYSTSKSLSTITQHVDGRNDLNHEEECSCRSLHSDVRPEFLVSLAPYTTHLRWRPLLDLWVEVTREKLQFSLGDVPAEEELKLQEDVFMMRKKEEAAKEKFEEETLKLLTNYLKDMI